MCFLIRYEVLELRNPKMRSATTLDGSDLRLASRSSSQGMYSFPSNNFQLCI